MGESWWPTECTGNARVVLTCAWGLCVSMLSWFTFIVIVSRKCCVMCCSCLWAEIAHHFKVAIQQWPIVPRLGKTIPADYIRLQFRIRAHKILQLIFMLRWLITFHVFKPYLRYILILSRKYANALKLSLPIRFSDKVCMYFSLPAQLTPLNLSHHHCDAKRKSKIITQIYPNSRCSNTLTSKHYLFPHILRIIQMFHSNVWYQKKWQFTCLPVQ